MVDRKQILKQPRLQALTLIQPMGTAIVYGPKRIENRTWAPPVDLLGKYILIHTGTKWSQDYDDAITVRWPGCPEKDALPFGFIIGAARLIGLVREARGAKRDVVTVQELDGKKGAAEEIFEKNKEWYMAPQWGWVLDDVFDLPRPVHSRGLMKLWTPGHITLDNVLHQIERHRL